MCCDGLKGVRAREAGILHVIDHATRFSDAAVIRSKRKEVIINQLFRIWISMFGTPGKFLSDNGGEFANQEFFYFAESFCIIVKTTAAESTLSNELCEHHNLVVSECISRILEDMNCSLEIALPWAINAKNSLLNVYGFSPYILVFGRNPQLPLEVFLKVNCHHWNQRQL